MGRIEKIKNGYPWRTRKEYVDVETGALLDMRKHKKIYKQTSKTKKYEHKDGFNYVVEEIHCHRKEKNRQETIWLID